MKYPSYDESNSGQELNKDPGAINHQSPLWVKKIRNALLWVLALAWSYGQAQTPEKINPYLQFWVNPAMFAGYNIDTHKPAVWADIQFLSYGGNNLRVGINLVSQVQLDENITWSLGKALSLQYQIDPATFIRLVGWIHGIDNGGKSAWKFAWVWIKATLPYKKKSK